MPAIHPPAPILVTGASGFVGAYVVRGLAAAGYVVRGAVRSPEKGEYIKSLGAAEYVVIPDMLEAGSYAEAVKDVEGVVHASSKPDVTNPGDPDLVIAPAVAGTLSLLQAVEGSSVRRVVLIGSAAAVSLAQSDTHDETGVYSGAVDFAEVEWNDEVVAQCEREGAATPPPYKYHASKVKQERAFWEYFQTHRDGADGVSLLLGYVLGPPLEYSATRGEPTGSEAFLVPWVKGTFDAPLDTPFYDFVAACDVMAAVVAAFAEPKAGGERFLISAGPTFFNDYAVATSVLNRPGLTAGNPDPEYRAALLAKAGKYDSSKAQRVLGLKWRDKDETIKEAMRGVAKVIGAAK